MDPSACWQIVIICILLLLSAFFSSAETALTSVNRIKIRTLAETRKAAVLVQRLLENQSKLLSAILIGNNIVNLTASSLTSVLAQRLWSNAVVSIAIGILTFLVIIFGEIIPKIVASVYSETLSILYAPILYVYILIMTPLIWFINLFSDAILFVMRVNPNKKETLTEDELLTVVEASTEDGVIEDEEKEMITNVVDFGDSVAKDIMVPRIDVNFIHTEMTYDDIVACFRESNFSRLPVFEDTPDNIIGILYLKDLFRFDGAPETFDLRSTMRKPYYTFEFKKTSELLAELRRDSLTIAVVLDEYGSTAGIITLEDLLEEIVGEIRDEYDSDEQDPICRLSDTEYLVDGTAKLEDIDELLGCSLESEDYDSIAGHIYHCLEHIPEQGERFTDEHGVTYEVVEVDKKRIDKVRILIPEKEAAEEK